MAKEKFDEKEGVWRTVRGRRIFIAKGEDLATAMRKSGKFENLKREDVIKGKRDIQRDKLFKENERSIKTTMHGKTTAERKEKEYEKIDKNNEKALRLERENYEYDNPKEATDIQDLKGKHIDKKQVENAKYNETKKDVLEYFSEDFGYEDTTPEKAFVEQIDYMKNPNESIHDTAKRFVEGGSMLVYNQDMAEYLNKKE